MSNASPTPPVPASDLLLQARPRLIPGATRRANEAGEELLVGPRSQQYMGLADGDQGVLDLLDGERTLEDVLRDALGLPIPVRPLAVLALLRRLRGAALLEGLEEVEGELFDHTPPTFMGRLLWWLASVSVELPGTASLGGLVGSRVPRGFWRPASRVCLWLFGCSLLLAALAGQLGTLLDPFAGPDVEVRALTLYAAVALSLTWRGILRGGALASHGLRVPALRLRVLVGVLHVDLDDRERRAAPRTARAAVAWTGLGALALAAGLSTLAWLASGGGEGTVGHALASTGIYLVLADLMPYGRGDGWHLVGIATGIPDLRRRSASFLLRRAVRNVLRSEPVGPVERTYLRVASAWMTHAVLSLYLLTGFLLPGSLHAVLETARHPLTGGPLESTSSVLTLVGTATLLVLVLGFCILLVLLVIAWIAQLTGDEPSRPPRHSEPVGERAEHLIDDLRRVPFLGGLEGEELLGMVAGMRQETHADGDIIVKQGEPGDRFCLLFEGQAEVQHEEESGLVHGLARLQEGDFFGEIALLEDVPRTATVRAVGDVVVLSLDRETFLALVERSRFPREEVLEQVRNAAFLRTVPVFQALGAELMGRLLRQVRVLRCGPGETIITQGEPGDAMYVIREGRCEVVRRPDGPEAEPVPVSALGVGELFGEIALMRGVQRTATVRTLEPTTLVKVPAEVLDEVLLEDVRAGMTLRRSVARRLRALEAL